MKGFCSGQVFLALIPLGNYEFKFNQLSGASDVEVTPLFEAAKGCRTNMARNCFYAIIRLFSFVDIFPVSHFFFENSVLPSCCNPHT